MTGGATAGNERQGANPSGVECAARQYDREHPARVQAAKVSSNGPFGRVRKEPNSGFPGPRQGTNILNRRYNRR